MGKKLISVFIICNKTRLLVLWYYGRATRPQRVYALLGLFFSSSASSKCSTSQGSHPVMRWALHENENQLQTSNGANDPSSARAKRKRLLTIVSAHSLGRTGLSHEYRHTHTLTHTSPSCLCILLLPRVAPPSFFRPGNDIGGDVRGPTEEKKSEGKKR